MRQIVPFILLALLLHALVLLAFYFHPSDPQPMQRQTIDVSLDVQSPGNPPVAERQPPPTTPPSPPKPQPIPDETPAATLPPRVSETPPTSPAVPASTAPPQNSAPLSEEVQPLFRLTRLPSFLKKIEAVYPASERRAGIQANVLAEVTIDAQGNVVNVRILKSGGATFDEAAKQALQKSVFNPGMIEGKPVGTRFQIPFRFNLN